MSRFLPGSFVRSLAALRRLARPALLLLPLGALVPLSGCGGGGNDTPLTSLVGSWGGSEDRDRSLPATLQITAMGAELGTVCQPAISFSQPVQPDSSGHFSIMGTQTSFNTSGSTPVRLEGVVSGRHMTLSFFYPESTVPYRTFTVDYGRKAPEYTEPCVG